MLKSKSVPLNIQPKPLRVDVPACKHRISRHCRYLSDALGKFAPVNPIVCGKLCKANKGPVDRDVISIEDRRQFLTWGLYHYYMGIAPKALRNYAREMHVGVPEIWHDIKSELAWLADVPWIEGICCTGSLCVKGKSSFKDFDIVIRVVDSDQAFHECFDLQKRLPLKVFGVPVDYFFSHTIHCQFFAVLDPDAKKFYSSSWFGANAVMHDGIEWIPVESDEIDQSMKALLAQHEPGLCRTQV